VIVTCGDGASINVSSSGQTWLEGARLLCGVINGRDGGDVSGSQPNRARGQGKEISGASIELSTVHTTANW
jgi:hypothetical protein